MMIKNEASKHPSNSVPLQHIIGQLSEIDNATYKELSSSLEKSFEINLHGVTFIPKIKAKNFVHSTKQSEQLYLSMYDYIEQKLYLTDNKSNKISVPVSQLHSYNTLQVTFEIKFSAKGLSTTPLGFTKFIAHFMAESDCICPDRDPKNPPKYSYLPCFF